ncbi:peptidyl-prolyl cis-trans isomerase [Paenibacillus sp. HWE-109]|uniref:peptidyl-prolyl cis-trans isomerase n=1 Tax=Paenibacillus sp. HWE-109 TaxID=1306526 RepID=UPI001EE0578A|nr:peptidyl-prolyl cis-trans isomerase [Paenibacillus sp. HWE-109]UKS26321.1 peptidyl-prolyl cis-trans isomerase [Paenibacillus sp. HWE-109]
MNTHIKTNRAWKWVSTVLLLSMIAYVLIYPPLKKAEGSTAMAAGTAVAKVNGVTISSSQLYDAMLATGGDQTLDSLITEELINQESQKSGIQVTDADIQAELTKVQSSYGSDTEFQQALTSYGMTLDDLKKNMKTQVLLKKILAPQVTITDDDIKKYYDANLESLKTPEQVQVSHIAVATKEEADALAAALKAGGDFAALAKEKSLDAATKDKSGELGYIAKGSADAAFETAAFAMKVGANSDPIPTSTGYDIIKVTDHKMAATPTLEEKKESIKQSLTDEKLSTLASSWLEEQKGKSTVENYLTKK